MDLFQSIPLSSAGRPVFLDGEVEIRCDADVSVILQEDKKVIKELLPPGLLVLTNYRILAVVMQKGVLQCWGLNFSYVLSAEDCAKFFGSSARIALRFSHSDTEIGVRVEKKEKLEILGVFRRIMDKKSWLSMPVPASTTVQPVVHSFSSSNAGVSGIIRRQERQLNSVDTLSRAALSDLDALVALAKDTIVVIQRYASYQVEKGEGSESAGEDNEMETIMQNIGIVSPVTKFSAGRAYHEQLARQMADLLLTNNRLQKLGGMITLTDVYCLLNRARGTVLVSPDDLFRASVLVDRLNLGMTMRTFKSGVVVLQSSSFNEEELGERIGVLLSSEGGMLHGVQASDVARQLNISIVLAKEQLLMIEAKEIVCRDMSTGGLFFFANRFRSLNSP